MNNHWPLMIGFFVLLFFGWIIISDLQDISFLDGKSLARATGVIALSFTSVKLVPKIYFKIELKRSVNPSSV
jgi:hypothetical protein